MCGDVPLTASLLCLGWAPTEASKSSPTLGDTCAASFRQSGAGFTARSSGREVRISWYHFFLSILVGEPNPPPNKSWQKGTSRKGRQQEATQTTLPSTLPWHRARGFSKRELMFQAPSHSCYGSGREGRVLTSFERANPNGRHAHKVLKVSRVG